MKLAIDSLFVEPRQPRPVSRRDHYWSLELSPGYDNIGNYFIAESLTEILDFEEAYVISTHVNNMSSDEAIDFVNENCDAFVLRGSTMLYPGRIKKWLPYDLIKKIKIPIIWLGVGNENSTGIYEVDFDEEEIKSLKYISESAPFIMVRGEVTANILNKAGIHNVKLLGCPTIYWSKMPQNKISKPTWENTIWTWREHLYSTDHEMELALNKAQFSLVNELFEKSNQCSIFFQDMSEIHWARYALARNSQENKAYYFDNRAWPPRIKQINIDKQKLIDEIDSKYQDICAPEQLKRMRDASYYSFDVAEWKERAKQASFVIGCRLHGNMIALSHGIPAFFYIYDERVKEVIDLIKAPSEVLTPDTTLPSLESLDFSAYERRYSELYAEFKGFLNHCGLSHNLM